MSTVLRYQAEFWYFKSSLQARPIYYQRVNYFFNSLHKQARKLCEQKLPNVWYNILTLKQWLQNL